MGCPPVQGPKLLGSVCTGVWWQPLPCSGALTTASPVPEALGAVAPLSEPPCTSLPDLLLLFKRKVFLVCPLEQ